MLIRPVSMSHEEGIIDTPDGDFLEADYYEKSSERIAILSHGLEGNSQTRYMTGMAKVFLDAGWSVLAWNFRGCGSRMNRLLSMYHSGKTEDLETVIDFAINELKFKTIVLIGFSVGGNITLKYLGEKGDKLPSCIKAAVAISPPVNLGTSADRLARWDNILYMMNFLQTLGNKLRRKAEQYPGKIELRPLRSIRTFRRFDDTYTAPLNGFANAADYYQQCSSIFYLDRIRIPTLILTAKNDPFLPDTCYPVKEAESNKYLYLEMPDMGGHVGFFGNRPEKKAWMYYRALEFITQAIQIPN